MKARFLLLFLLGLPFLPATTSRAQAPIPIEVFAEHDRSAAIARLFFANPISGLSTPVTIEGFARERLVAEAFTVTALGVMFINPADGRVSLATPDGRITQHPFIPQLEDGLESVEWILSPNGRRIVWVEVYLIEGGRVSIIFSADVTGENLTQLPPPPATVIDAAHRIRPLTVTNDGEFLFYDIATPAAPRSLTDYFDDYQNVYVYINSRRTHQRLPGEPGCLCAAGISGSGHQFLRLRSDGGSFSLHLWNLDSNSERIANTVAPAFAQAGDFFVPEGLSIALYSQAQNLEDSDPSAQFALMRVDLVSGTQTMLLGPSSQRFRASAVVDNGAAIMISDVYGGATFKLDVFTSEMALVSEQIWLGTMYQQ
jgi:hypothetical protein